MYPLQGQTGESVSRPNAFRVRGVRTASQLTLQAVQAAFPLAGLGTFHFRWKVRPQELGNAGRQTPASASGGAPPRSSFKSCYLDVTNPSDSIPLFDGKAIAKVLLLGTIPNVHAAKRATHIHQLTLSIGVCTCYGGACPPPPLDRHGDGSVLEEAAALSTQGSTPQCSRGGSCCR